MNKMKEKCDNHCETCPMQSQIYCSLMFAKANNAAINSLAARVANIEQVFTIPQHPNDPNNLKHPATTLNPISVKPSDAQKLDE